MLNLTIRLCWVLVKKEGYIAIWQKPTNNTCYLSRDGGDMPPLCNSEDDPDSVWYVFATLIFCFFYQEIALVANV